MNKLLKKSLYTELYEEDLETRLEDILEGDIEQYGLCSVFGVQSLGDLLEIDYDDLVEADKAGKIRNLGKVKRRLHKFGCTLKNEYASLGISEAEALIPVSEFDVSSRVIRALRSTGRIDVLGELLTVPYGELSYIRHFGAKSQKELKEYVESLGYNLCDTGTSVLDIKASLRSQGEILVEDVIDSRAIMLALNRAGIYTLDGLLDRDLRSIPGIGKIYQDDIINRLRDYAEKISGGEYGSSDDVVEERDSELTRLEEKRDTLRMRNIELVLEQAEVTNQLEEIKLQIKEKSSKTGAVVQYGKK